MIEHFWKPADGFRVCARNIDKLCDDCKPKVDEIVEAWDWARYDTYRRHAAAKRGECEGLKLAPIIVTVLNLPRREGKTFNVAVFILSIIFLTLRRFVLFVATAGSQSEKLFEDNFEKVIEQSDEMSDACDVTGHEIKVPSTGSFLRVAKTTTHRTITGGGYTHIVLEEARDLHPRIVAAAVLSVRDQNGYECPVNPAHVVKPGIGGEPQKHKCPKCGTLLVPWWPRIIIPSSSGIVEDSNRDWFNQLVELLREACPENYYLYSTQESTNPAVQKDISDALADGFGRVPAMRTYIEVELTNIPRREGDDFITKTELAAITDPTLVSLEGSELECVGYLDTSWSQDKTSFMIAGWDPEESTHPWQTLRVLHWQYWEPKRLPKKVIDPAAVQAHLDRYVPNFPNLRMALVDDRGCDWAKLLVIECNQNRRGWGEKIKLFHGKRMRSENKDKKIERAGNRIPGIFGGEDDRARAWQHLEQRIFLGRSSIIIPQERELHAELLGVTRVALPEGGYEIRDRNRNKKHADLADCLAGVCLLAYLLSTNQRDRLDGRYSAKRNSALARMPLSAVVGRGGFGI